MPEPYLEMWKELGIDIERHNQLLEGLSNYVEAKVLSQKNRPEKMDYFNFVLSEVHGLRIKELLDIKKQGRKVIGAFCLYAPEEIAVAAGAVMVGLCGGSSFPFSRTSILEP